MFRLFALTAAVSLFAMGGPAGAIAQSHRYYDEQPVANYPYKARSSRQVCERYCPHDTAPCDPIEFKLADGRCQNTRYR